MFILTQELLFLLQQGLSFTQPLLLEFCDFITELVQLLYERIMGQTVTWCFWLSLRSGQNILCWLWVVASRYGAWLVNAAISLSGSNSALVFVF